MGWEPGTAVLWRSVRNGVVHAANLSRVLRDGEDLIALYTCPGNRGRRRKGRRGGPSGRLIVPGGWTGEYEDSVWHTNRALFLYRPGDAHSIGLFWRESDGEFRNWYVNLEAPWRRSAVGFDTWDHTLDLVVAPDLSSWEWKDEDEFAWSQEVGIISPAEAHAVRAEAECAIQAIERRSSPYCDGWERWSPDPSWSPLTEMPANWNVVE